MNMAGKIYPSQRRYNERNPKMNFRMKKEEKEKLEKMMELSGKNLSDLVRTALLGLEKDFSKAYKKAHSEGYEKGFADAKKKYRICFHCARCADYITILPNSDAHRAIISYMEEKGWGHEECNLE